MRLAPIATRTAISRVRAGPVASNKFTTFTEAVPSTSTPTRRNKDAAIFHRHDEDTPARACLIAFVDCAINLPGQLYIGGLFG